MEKVKNIFKGKDQDAEKTAAFTGQEGGGIDESHPDKVHAKASGLSSEAQSGENTSAFTGASTGGTGQKDIPEGDVGHKPSPAKGLSSQAQSGENTSSFTG